MDDYEKLIRETLGALNLISERIVTKKEYLNFSELCEWLNIKKPHGRKMLYEKSIPYKKIGHLLRFSRIEIEAWLDENSYKATKNPDLN